MIKNNISKVTIVGAGLIGRILALLWLRSIPNIQLTLIDKAQSLSEHSGCGYASAGMVAPFSEIDLTSPELSLLGQQSLLLWPKILALLPSNTIFQQSGTLIIVHPNDVDNFCRLQKQIEEHFCTEHYSVVTKSNLAILEPELTGEKFYQNIVHLPLEANIHVPNFYQATTHYFEQHENVNYISKNIADIKKEVAIVESDYIFDTRGLGAKSIFHELHGIRGESIVVHAPNVQLRHMLRLIHPRYPIYIVPRGQQHYYIGATVIQGEDNSPISIKSILELTSALYTIHPGFYEARIVKTITQSRPTLFSVLPQVNYKGKFIELNGFYRHGHLLGPTICQQIIEKLSSERNDDRYCA